MIMPSVEHRDSVQRLGPADAKLAFPVGGRQVRRRERRDRYRQRPNGASHEHVEMPAMRQPHAGLRQPRP